MNAGTHMYPQKKYALIIYKLSFNKHSLVYWEI